MNADRDLGRNGTFLVVRQLEQDVGVVLGVLPSRRRAPGSTGSRRACRLRPEEFIAAKIVGRWRDGSPLVRYPRWPASDAPRPSHPLLSDDAAGRPKSSGTSADRVGGSA